MERKGKGAVRWLQCSSVVLLGWCWCAAAELNFAFLLFPSSLGLASCNSVSRSLLPAPSAVRVQSARLKDAIVSWWTSFSV